MDNTQAKFEGWAVVELFGHQREAGFVTTEYYGPAAMFRIDTPEFPEREYELERPEYVDFRTIPKGSKVRREAQAARTRLVGPSAIYALNPCTEEAARKVIESMNPRPLAIVALPEGKQLAAPVEAEDDSYMEPDEEDEYDEEIADAAADHS